jgi:hypothetical protein
MRIILLLVRVLVLESRDFINFRNINIPWEGRGKTDADYLYVFTNIVLPAAMEFNPDLVVYYILNL